MTGSGEGFSGTGAGATGATVIGATVEPCEAIGVCAIGSSAEFAGGCAVGVGAFDMDVVDV